MRSRKWRAPVSWKRQSKGLVRAQWVKLRDFFEFERNDRDYAPVEERVKTWHEFVLPLTETETRDQAARCMDCGVPYCHTGCPVNNQIPDWNDLVYQATTGRKPSRNLHSTNNFPEFTGRVCPRRAKPPARSISKTRRSRSRRSNARSSTRRSRTAGSSRSRRRTRPARRWPSSALGPRDWRQRSSSRASGMRFTCSRSSPRPAGFCVTAFPTSRWRRSTSTAASRRWKRKA